MLLKLFLLVIFFILLGLLTKLLELMRYYGWEHQIDPTRLGVKQLKSILDRRGISYSGLLEKYELISIANKSGILFSEELYQIEAGVIDISCIEFKSEKHFIEEVEDTKDSVWVVYVDQLASEELHNSPPASFIQLSSKLRRFGVRTGVFHCYHDRIMCKKRGWYNPLLLLAVPAEGNVTKGDVTTHLTPWTSDLNTQSDKVMPWINHQLTSRFNSVNTVGDFHRQWSNFSNLSDMNEVHLIALTDLPHPPMFLSTLNIRYSSRVKMVHVSKGTDLGDHLINEHDPPTGKPVYLLITSDHNLTYGVNKVEQHNFNSLDLYLKLLYPDINDVFLWSVILVNLLCCLSWPLHSSDGVVRTLIHLAASFIKGNLLLLTVWLCILLSFPRLPYSTPSTQLALQIFRLSHPHAWAHATLHYWLVESSSTSQWILPLLFISYCLLLSHLLVGVVTVPEERDETSLFPFSIWGVSAGRDDIDDEDHLLIQRLAVPHLWLQTSLVPLTYLDHLPTWNHQLPQNQYSDESDPDSSSASDSGGKRLHRRHVDGMVDEGNGCCNEGEGSNGVNEQRCEASSSTLPSCSVHSSTCSNNVVSPQKRRSKAQRLRSSCSRLFNKLKKIRGRRRKSAVVSCKEKEVVASHASIPPGMLERSECAICLDNYEDGDLLCGLPCGHPYHYTCIMKWLYTDNHCCPVCRWPSYRPKHRK